MKMAMLIFKKVFDDTGIEVVAYGTVVRPMERNAVFRDTSVFKNVFLECLKYQYQRLMFLGS